MRIIDKNKDFYDYLQDPEDSVVFDRRASFLLTKDMFCKNLSCMGRRGSKDRYKFVLMQVCNTFWLFLCDVTKYDDTTSIYTERVLDYNIDLLAVWKNYDAERALLRIDVITFGYDLSYSMLSGIWRNREYSLDKIISHIPEMTDAINRGDFYFEKNMNSFTQYRGDVEEKKTIPLLKACGIAPLVDPLTIFNSIDEFFSLERQAAERTESVGLTNNDKIVMHGFDTKTSFRGKNR